jgi:hypothetical protein
VAITVVRASSQYAEATSCALGSGTLAAYTLAGWYKPSSIADGVIFGFGDSNSTHYVYLGMDVNAKVNIGSATTAEATGVSTGVLTSGVWNHAAGVVTSAASRTAYANGSPGGANTTSRAPTGLDRTTIGGLIINGTRGTFGGGDIAECAAWNVALDAAEVAALAKGVSPLLVRPSSLVFYAPLLLASSPEQDLRNSLALTFGVTTAAPTKATSHPPMFKPSGLTRVSKTSTGGGAPAFSSTMAVSTHPAVAVTAAKGASGTLVAQARPSAALAGQKRVSGTLGTSARPLTAVAGQKGATGTLVTSARPSAVTAGRKGASGALGISARPSVMVVGQKGISATLGVSAHPAVSVAGSSAPVFVGAMSVTARPGVAMLAIKGGIGALSATTRSAVAMSARKGVSSATIVGARPAVVMSASLGVRSVMTLAARPLVTITAARGAAGAMIIIGARPRVAITGTLVVVEHADHGQSHAGRLVGAAAGVIISAPAGRPSVADAGILTP